MNYHWSKITYLPFFYLFICIPTTRSKHPTKVPPTTTPFPKILTTHVVSINQDTGINKPECINRNKVCRDLHYAYHMTLAGDSIYNIIMLKIHGDYVLKETFHINNTVNDLKALHIIGVDRHTKVTPASPDVSIIIGFNRTGYDAKSLQYNVTFTNLTITGFGSKHPAAIIGWHVKNVIFRDNAIIDNKCSGLNLLNTAVDIQGCLFQNNSVNVLHNQGKHGQKAFPGGTASAGGGVGLIYDATEINYLFYIRKNMFIDNKGETYTSKCIAQTSDSKYAFSRSGGGLIIAMINSSNCVGEMSHNHFIRNSAALGGGLMISNHGFGMYNQFYMDNCTFDSNRASSTGGGLSFSNWDRMAYNKLEMSDCNFTANQARVAGGMKILDQSRDPYNENAPGEIDIVLINVLFERNRANVASGIHMIFNLVFTTKPIKPVVFLNTIFAHHSLGFQDITSGPSAFSGVVLTNKIDLMFEGHNQWYNNSFESPLYASNADVHVPGNLTFANNVVQTSGGGITLSDVAHIIVYPGSNLVFVDNYAQVKGGAMFVKTVGFPEMVYKYNPSCFIQYLDPKNRLLQIPPDEWQVRILLIS